jgi:hypothetical protein
MLSGLKSKKIYPTANENQYKNKKKCKNFILFNYL